MKNYGDENIVSPGEIINADIESGTSDPSPSLAGRLFYRSDLHAMRVYNGTSWASVATSASSGTVSSVALADGSSTPIYGISGSPVTTTGTLTFTLAQQTVNTIFAGPGTGSSGQPTFRS